MSHLPTLKITGDSPLPQAWSIFLDGQKVRGVYRLELVIDQDDVTSVRMELTPESIEVDGPVSVELLARLREAMA